MKQLFLCAALAGAALLGALGALNASAPQVRAAEQTVTPPPTPPPIGTDGTPQPNATLIPLGGAPAPGSTPPGLATPSALASPGSPPAPGASMTPSPPPSNRKGVEGVWEVQIQHPDRTDYTHLQIAQSGGTLNGVYLDSHGKKYPLAGSIDGKSIRLVVSMPDGTTLLLEGTLDGTSDIVGMITTPKDQTPFTAAYRAKAKWIDNVNAAPGGLGAGSGGSGGAGGGGYGPPR